MTKMSAGALEMLMKNKMTSERAWGGSFRAGQLLPKGALKRAIREDQL